MRHLSRTTALAGALALLLSACTGSAGSGDARGSSTAQGRNADPAQVDSTEVPELGQCRDLRPEDVALPANATAAIDCTEEHTAQTYAVGTLPASLQDATYDSTELGTWAYQTCSEGLMSFLGADESSVMRTIVTWAWFRPSEAAWDDGARWYRCDVLGGGGEGVEYQPLPKTAEGLLMGLPPDEWMVCADGPAVVGSPKVSCSEQHTWRAVTTIKVGEQDEKYPGDRLVEVTTRDFCSDSVAAWLGYPIEYDFGFTWFKEAEWEVGNRRSVCWARTSS